MPAKPKDPARKKKAIPKKRPTGRPSKRTPRIVKRILAGLEAGIPLTVICKPSDMPSDTTVRNWAGNDEALSYDIARAREAGHDQIAMDALNIADEVTSKDTIQTKFGEIPNKEWIMRSKLRVETRLKLLAKWDPKRYGDKVTTEISGPDGKPIKSETSHRISEEMQDAIMLKTMEAARIAANVEPPASFRGGGGEE